MTQHFYDGQVRRYITQIIRLFSNFSVKDNEGTLRQVPVMYGDLTRQVANIIRENSENKLPSAPRMAVYIAGVDMDRTRTSDSSFVSKVHIRERAYDENGQEYLNTQGKNYTVERLMPTPYTLTVNVDVWTTNTDQKLQILEQVWMLFNPSLEIQTTDNFVDWTSLSVLNLERTEFSNRSIPVGVDSDIDIATLTFSTPIYISPPAKVKRLGIITNIITSIFNENTGSIIEGLSGVSLSPYQDLAFEVSSDTVSGDGTETTVDTGEFPNVGTGELNISTERKVTPVSGNKVTWSTTYQNYSLYVLGNTVQLIDKQSVGTVNWRTVLEAYPGMYRPGISKIQLRKLENSYIVGYITLNPLDETKLSVSWDADTLPSNTVIEGPARNSNSWTSIDYIIDPLRWNPQERLASGLRLLLLDNIGSATNSDGADAWKNTNGTDFVADANDIVEWDGSSWHIVMDASETTESVYTSNLNTGIQYAWDGNEWIQSWEGEYSGGTWMIYLDG
jgi:T4-like virus Myoviridae tail sheath stabiliser